MPSRAARWSTIRSSPAYRGAVWLVRVANLVVLPVLAWDIGAVFGLVPAPPDAPFALAWGVGVVTTALALVLFHRAGVRLVVLDGGRSSVTPPATLVLRDVFWPGHRHKPPATRLNPAANTRARVIRGSRRRPGSPLD